MKRVALLILLAGCFAPFASAQDDNEHAQVGVFADYLRLDQTSTNFGGVGARVSFQAYKRIKLEGQMAYDFDQAFAAWSPAAQPRHFGRGAGFVDEDQSVGIELGLILGPCRSRCGNASPVRGDTATRSPRRRVP